MATTNQSVDVFPIAEARSGVRAKATFSAEGDVTDWQLINGKVAYQGYGPVDAATVGLQRSTLDPSGGAGNPVEVDDATGSGGGGLGATVDGVGNAWYRLINKTTFGPANAVTARSLASLAAAINGLQPVINGFAPGTAPQPLVHAAVTSPTTLLLTAVTPGVAGNAIASTETLANGSFGATTLAGGADAAAAVGTLAFTTQPANNDTVAINGRVYTFKTTLTGAADEVLLGANVTTARDNLLAAINAAQTGATGTLTAAGNPAAGDTVQIGGRVYKFVAALTGAPYEVLRDPTTATTSLDHLVAAVMSGTGGGVNYGINTPPNAAVSAIRSASTVIATARVPGLSGRLIKTIETSANLSWGATTLAGGTGLGITYGLGTVQNVAVAASAATADLMATARAAGTAGNAITTTAVSTHIAWGAGTLASGANLAAATGTLTMTGLPVTTNTVTIGAVVYTFKTALTPTAGEVMIAGTTMDVTLTGERTANA